MNYQTIFGLSSDSKRRKKQEALLYFNQVVILHIAKDIKLLGMGRQPGRGSFENTQVHGKDYDAKKNMMHTFRLF